MRIVTRRSYASDVDTQTQLLRLVEASGKVVLWCVTRAGFPRADRLSSRFEQSQSRTKTSSVRKGRVSQRQSEPCAPRRNRCEVVYAVVRAGGRQEKVEVGTIVVLDRQKAKIGDTLELPAVLFVDGDAVTTDADKLAKVTVTAEVLGEERGPKIVIQKFKNKTGYKKRQGHRQDLTRVKVTGIK